MSDPNEYIIGWICALPTEFVAAEASLDERHDDPKDIAPDDNNAYTLGRIGEHMVVIVLLPVGEYGLIPASHVARDMVRSFKNMRIVLLVGIGGGAPSKDHDIRLGDIIVSTPHQGMGGVFHYDYGKTIQAQSFQVTSFMNQPPAVLRAAVGKLIGRHKGYGHQYETTINDILEKRPILRREFSRPNQSSDRLYKSDVIHPKVKGASCKEACGDDAATLVVRPERTASDIIPSIHYGLIASANSLMMDATIRDKLADEKDVLCFEMEAAGLMNRLPCLVIRGICDYSDSHRTKEWQGYAAMAAAAYAKDLLSVIRPRNIEAERKIGDLLSQVATTVGSIKFQLERNEDREILDWITPSEYGPQQSDFINTRQEGTCQWLLDSAEYNTWLTADNQTLLCLGIPGTGKTILTAVVVDDLIAQTSTDLDTGLAYIYCNFQRQGTQMFDDLVASLLKQLSRKRPSLPDCVEELYHKHTRERTKPSHIEFAKALQSVVVAYSKTFIIIDALDECETSNHTRSKLLSFIFGLRNYIAINVFATSRHIPDIENELRGSLKREIRASDEDMRRYIKTQMQYLPKFLSLGLNLQEMRDEIIRAAQGMFLLTKLYFKAIIDTTSISEAKSILKNLSCQSTEEMGEDELRNAVFRAYEEAMERINSQRQDRQRLGRRVISWITFAKRPLLELELQHALAIRYKDTVLDEDNIREAATLISVCAGLVQVDKESGIIRLVHYTTQEYFNQTQNQWFPDSETEITRICCTYLSFNTFQDGFCQTEKEFKERLQSNPLYDYAAANWGYHAHSLEKIPQEVIDFLTCRAKVEASSQVLLQHHYGYDWYWLNETNPKPSSIVEQATGLHLAAYFGISKAVDFLPQDKESLEFQDTYEQVPLIYAAENGHVDIARLLLEKGATVDAMTPTGWSALCLAVMGEHEGVFRLLLEAGADVEVEDDDGNTPLHLAISVNKINMVRLLLENGAAVETVNDGGSTPLLLAAENGHEDIVQLLLEYGASKETKDKSDKTPLRHAIIKKHEHVVRLLLREGAALEERDAFGRTPLFFAVGSGDEAIAQLLLEYGSSRETKNNFSQTPLTYAITHKHENIVRLLLRKGAALEERDAFGRTPLFFAIGNGDEAIVRLLLEEGAAVETKDKRGVTPLLYAARYTHLGIIQLLLEKGAVANGALLHAAFVGNTHVVKFLLDKKFTVDERDSMGKTPLLLAVHSMIDEKRKSEIIQLLLDRGAAIQARGNDGSTALIIAACGTQTAIVELLLNRGAAIEERNIQGDTALLVAIVHERTATIDLLLERGAAIEARNIRGDTALLVAIVHERTATIDLLLERDAAIEARNVYGDTALLVAIAYKRTATVDLLLERGAAIEVRNIRGETALMRAANYGQISTINQLLDKGAIIKTRDNIGQTALSYASKAGNRDIMWLLRGKSA